MTLQRVEAHSWAHCHGDPRPATAYLVVDGGKVLGRVESISVAHEVVIGRIRYRRRGFSRNWRASTAGGHRVTSVARSRGDAVDALLASRR